MEPKFYSEAKVPYLFGEYADVVDGHTEFMSLKNFAALAAKYHMFTVKTQNEFLGQDFNHDYEEEAERVRSTYGDMKTVLKERLIMANLFTNVWEGRLEEVEKRLQANKYSDRCKNGK